MTLSIECCYAKCRLCCTIFSDCHKLAHYTECHYTKCRYAEWHSATANRLQPCLEYQTRVGKTESDYHIFYSPIE